MRGRGTGIAIAAASGGSVVRRSFVVRLCDGGNPIGLGDSALRPVVISEARVPVEEKQMRVEELVAAPKEPHKYFHREDIHQETSVRPIPAIGFTIISPRARQCPDRDGRPSAASVHQRHYHKDNPGKIRRRVTEVGRTGGNRYLATLLGRCGEGTFRITKCSLRSWLWRVPIEEEIDEEISPYLETRTWELVERGMDSAAARALAL
jgi:hypothetical protein